ncbi:MAG: amino acid adenylation domain-containing protein, partial [Pyrinomonadaceae bacterium]
MIGIDSSLTIGLKPRTLAGLLRQRGQSEPDRLAYCFLSDGKVEDERITYGELDQRAQTIAAMLQSLSAGGERALLLYPPGFDYIAAFFGCLYSGVVAVPAYPPRANRTQHLQLIAADAQATLALTTNSMLERLSFSSARKTGLEHLRWLATDRLTLDSNRQWSEPETLNEEALAYLQYTSGSTAAPKGVMVSHRNVLHNSAYIHYGFAHTPESIALSWLPHFHDMGLIDGIIQPLYSGFPGLLMSPASFLQRPLSWLEAISNYRVTHSGGPNFAYDLCVRRVSSEQRASLDLSRWRVAYNGAEPVRQETLERFAEEFASCGFRYENFYPAYGMAEATLKVTGGLAEDAPVICTLQASALERNRIIEAATGERDVRTLVSSGRAALETEVRIVNPELLVQCAPDEVGEIWVKGPGVAAGYWQRPEETERTFHAYLPEAGEGPFLRTGDLGFIKDGELFVTGRLKDLIIIRGRNHYPQDIELTVAASHPSLRSGGGAAFSVEIGGEERLVVAQEVLPRVALEWHSVIAAVREAISEEFEVQPAAILLLKPGSIPKTSSGKVRRNDSRIKFLSGDWDVIAEWHTPVGTDATGLAAPAPSLSSNVASLESWLQERVASMLGVQAAEIDLHCPLTRYGVDSLMAVELMHRIETSLGVVLPLAEFLQSPSLAELAARAVDQLSATSEKQRVAFAPSQPELKTGTVENGWHPLSHNQKSLWFMHHVAPESTAYNISFAARVSGELNTEALRRAFQSLVSRHPSLRTSFTPSQDEPVQRVHEQAELFFHLEDACQWSESKLGERLSLEAQHCFDLEYAPLLRVFLFKRTKTEHVLMLVAHHIIVDFWSLSVLMHELGEQYHAEVNGAQAALAPQTFRYADYVNWQQEFLLSAEGEAQERYWQQELAGELPVLDLPLDHLRPAVQSHRGASVPLRLDAALTQQLKALARSSDATLYMILLAAFGALLYRHTGQREALIGSPVSGRSSAQLSETVGYFVNPVVMRARASDEMSFTELLAGVRETALRAFAHQDYPFDLLVKRLQPERDPSRSPLFQAMFALHKARETEEHALAAFALGESGAQVNLGGLLLESMALDQRIAQFDLSLTMAEVNGELAASFEFCTDLFEASTIKRLAQHFRVLLEAIAADPSKRMADLPLLTCAEREQLLNEWSETQQVLSPVRCVHDSFELQAAQRPDQIAVICAGEQLSYGELNRRANCLARHLRARGVGPNVLVALCIERSIEMLVGILGTLKAGGAYVPLDPGYPQRRLAFMLEDTDAPFLLTQQKFSGSLPATTAQTIFLDQDWSIIARESDAKLEVEVNADNLAYVIYTSGSTGQPKGVMIGHGSLANYISAVTDEFAITQDDRILQFASFSFDISVEEIFSCLTRGATLVLRDDEMTASTTSLLRACREQRLTVLNLPTAYWHQLSASLTAADWSQAETVRLVITGSEKLQPERLSQWQAVVGQQVRLVDVYGPTEATIGSTMCDLTGLAGATDTCLKISIGRPLRHAQAYILDARLEPVPVGVAGELHLGGLGLSQGYLNHPKLTAEKFIPHPFGAGARLYKTGDLTRFLPDGNIEFLGRLDAQVKVRGFRIELGEIERALVQHTCVRDAVVILREEKSEKRLIAYLIADTSSAPTTHDLRLHLKERLPEYMLPSAFIIIDSLPLTPSGKVDTRALPAPDHARPELLNTFVAPQTELEQLLVHIWADVLKLERVGLNDNFFELGGDSILTIQVVARAQAAGLNLTAREMFKHPTVAELAAVSAALPAAQADKGQVTGKVPLTPIQRWFFAQE